jgi:tRNA A58 N-methylase Trm61
MLGFKYLYEDKASLYGPKHLELVIKHGMHVIDARAGCGCFILIQGTRIAQLSALVGKKGRVFAFEHRAGRLETLKHNIKLSRCTSK